MRFPQKTLIDLEWWRLCEHLATRCSGEQAAAHCLNLPFLESDEAWERLALVEELLKCMEAGDPPPSLPAEPVDEWLLRIAHEGAVTGDALRRIAKNLKLFVAIARYLDNRRDRLDRNARLVFPEAGHPSLLKLANLAGEIEESFEPDGSVSDRASAALSRLRSQLVTLRKRLTARLERIAEKEQDLLQDRTIALRNDRYVLPVRADAHRRLSGIVHGTSSTGATVFVEPEAVIEAGNELMLNMEEIAREEARIIAALSDAVRDDMEAVKGASRAIVEVEIRIAAARLSLDLKAAVPIQAPSGTASLVGARHPLLLLEGVTVIPCGIAVSSGQCAVISGPNAGGKTVVLKTVGLLGLMLAAGLPIPAEAESKMGIPRTILTDIGDDQSLKENLSTFSAHMTNIGGMLKQRLPGALVLLDELAAGTDPIEGAALAEAILERLVAEEATVLATTHFDALKTRALREGPLRNVAMGFDIARMRPTFALIDGTPGSSSALVVAGRYGAPVAVIARATALLPEGSRRLESAILALENERRRAAEERAALVDARRSAEVIERKQAAELQRLKSREEKFIDREREALYNEIRATRERVKEAELSIKRNRRDAKIVGEVRREVNEVEKKLDPGGRFSAAKAEAPPGRPAEPADIKPGAKVFAVTFGKEAVVATEARGGQTFVHIGRMKTKISLDDLRIVTAAPSPAAKRFAPDPRTQPTPRREDPIQTGANTVDLRGMTGEEAINAADAFLDRAMKEDQGVAFIIHGHGTGVLRGAVRTYVIDSPYVADSRPGEREEGGDGVTVVWLR